MPELPEVENVVRDLRTSILGRTITGVMFSSTALESVIKTPSSKFYESLLLETVSAVIRFGKYILMPLTNNNVLIFHLGMTGNINVSAVQEGDTMSERHMDIHQHCHFILELSDFENQDLSGEVELSFYDPRKFGKIWLVENTNGIENLDVPGLKSLGPDALDITYDKFVELINKGNRTVKSLLLDQTKLAGVGNIYADEACFVAKVHPARSVSSLGNEEAAKLWFAVKTVLKEGIHHGGSSISDFRSVKGEKGSYQQRHRVYSKTGTPCVECATPITRIKLVGRSTHFCPSCQRLPEGN